MLYKRVEAHTSSTSLCAFMENNINYMSHRNTGVAWDALRDGELKSKADLPLLINTQVRSHHCSARALVVLSHLPYTTMTAGHGTPTFCDPYLLWGSWPPHSPIPALCISTCGFLHICFHTSPEKHEFSASVLLYKPIYRTVSTAGNLAEHLPGGKVGVWLHVHSPSCLPFLLHSGQSN